MASVEQLTTEVPESFCPACKRKVDRATNFFDTVGPSPGDISICLSCGVMLVFQDDMTLRVATPIDLVGIPAETMDKLAGLKRAISEMRAQRKER